MIVNLFFETMAALIREVSLARYYTLRYNNIGVSSGRSTETYCRCLGSTIWNIPEEHAAADAYFSSNLAYKPQFIANNYKEIKMKEIPDFDIELSQAMDYIMAGPLAKKAFAKPPFPQYTNILRLLIQSVDRLADNCHMPEFTNHALPHICSIVRRASEWAEADGWLDKITEQEAGYLLLALVIHDIGMLSQDARDLPDEDRQTNMKGFADIANWVRRTHVIRLQVLRLLKEEIEKDIKLQTETGSLNGILLKDHILVVIGMAASHQCWEWDTKFISNTDSIRKLKLDIDKVAALNAVIAVCDLLDEDSNRCDTVTLIKYRHGTMENMAHWIRHALTVDVDGVRNHIVKITFRKLIPSDKRHEKIYRALRNHYRLVKLYNNRLKNINAEIEHVIFEPADGIPEFQDGISDELSDIWINLPEFKNHIVEQILSTFMKEALNIDREDTGMRRRLNKLGLETLDLTEELMFIEPPTIYFSDERILLTKGDFKEQLKYIKEQADAAYLDGNIGKLRHLCFTALKCWDIKVSLNDMYWIFTYVAVFQKYGNEMANFEYEYNNSLVPERIWQHDSKLIMEGEYQPLLDVLLLLLSPCTGEKWYSKYIEHLKKNSYYGIKDDIATELLLETIVGLLWYYNQDSDDWLLAADYLCNHIPQTLNRKFAGYIEQLKKLNAIIKNVYDEDKTNGNQYHVNPMEKAWIDFWSDDWKNQELNIPNLCRIGNYDRDYMEPVQGYLNLVRWNIRHQYDMLEYERNNRSDKNPQDFSKIRNGEEVQINIRDSVQKTEEREFFEREQYVGNYRYNRIILEQPLPIFWEQRKLIIDSLLGECRRWKYDSQEQRYRLIRLLALHTLEALRYWDLWQYIDVLRSETVFDFLNGTYVDRHGTYCGDKYALRECFINYIRGLESKGLNDDERRYAAKLLMKYAPEELDKIVGFITEKSIPLQGRFAINVVETFAEEFSAVQKKKLINWLIIYNEFYKKQSRYFNLNQYEFLRYWFSDMDNEDWEKIEPILDTVFVCQTNMMSNSKLAYAVFDYAPWELCMKYVKSMKSFPDNARKSYDFYSVVIAMSKRKDIDKQSGLAELKRFVSCLLDDINLKISTASEDILKSMKMRYEELEKLIEVDRLDELEAVDLSIIEQILLQMEQEIEKRAKLSGYDSTLMNPVKDTFINKNWNVEDKTREQQIIDRIFAVMEQYKENMSLLFFNDFCRLLISIENSCDDYIRSYINHIVIENLVRKDFFLIQKQSEKEKDNHIWDGPYERIRFDDGSNNQYEIMVSLLLLYGMTVFNGEEKIEAVRYMIKVLNIDEPVIYNYAVVLFSYFFLNENEKAVSYLAWGGLQFILGRIIAENKRADTKGYDEIKSWVYKAIDTMSESEKWFKKGGFSVCAENNNEYREWLEGIYGKK